MAANTTRVALIQMACAPSTAENLDRAADFVRQAARDGAKLICLPELFRAQYFCQREDHALFTLAEPIPGPSTERLSAIVREEKITLVASLFERRAAGVYHNTAAILDSASSARDSIAGVYRKMHIPDDPLYYEKFYFTPGAELTGILGSLRRFSWFASGCAWRFLASDNVAKMIPQKTTTPTNPAVSIGATRLLPFVS